MPRGPVDALSLCGHSFPAFSRCGSAGSLSIPRASSSGSLNAAHSMRNMAETPPGATDAFEAHKVLVHCPPPLRAQPYATRHGDGKARKLLI